MSVDESVSVGDGQLPDNALDRLQLAVTARSLGSLTAAVGRQANAPQGPLSASGAN